MLYFLEISIYLLSFIVSPLFLHSRILICFHTSLIDCFILLFHQGSFISYSLFVFFNPNFFPTYTAVALISLFLSLILILSVLILFNISFTSLKTLLTAFQSIFFRLIGVFIFPPFNIVIISSITSVLASFLPWFSRILIVVSPSDKGSVTSDVIISSST